MTSVATSVDVRPLLLSGSQPDDVEPAPRSEPSSEDVAVHDEIDIPYDQVVTPPDRLTDEERDSIESYAINGFDRVNRALRGEIPRSEALDRVINLIRSGLRKYPLLRNARVTRRASIAAVPEFDPNDPSSIVGLSVAMPGFFSTSMLRTPPMLKASDLILDVTVPEGTPAFALGDLAEFDLEREMLVIDGPTMLFLGVVFDQQAQKWRLIGVIDKEDEA